MADLKTFRFVNDLTQEELGTYLGVNKSYISKVEKGKENFPRKHIEKLLANDQGWNTTPLLDANVSVGGSVANSAVGQNAKNIQLCPAPSTAELNAELELLRKQVEEKDRIIANLEQREMKLTAWIDRLLKVEMQ